MCKNASYLSYACFFFQMYFVTRENQAMEHQDGPFFFYFFFFYLFIEDTSIYSHSEII